MRLIQYTYPTTTARFFPALGYGRSPWTGLENEIDRLFTASLSGFAGGRAKGNPFAVDLYDDPNNTYVRAELPGVAREAINVEVTDGVLTVTAGKQSRSLTLPEHAQADKVAAALENGILTITVPKPVEAKPRKIAVQVQ